MKPIDNRDYFYIRQALQKAETLNSRNERSIPLYRLKEELDSRSIPEDSFKSYLYRYAPQSQRDYIEMVSKQIYHTPAEEIDHEEKFLITSGLC